MFETIMNHYIFKLLILVPVMLVTWWVSKKLLKSEKKLHSYLDLVGVVVVFFLIFVTFKYN
jgi:hypothetical protein